LNIDELHSAFSARSRLAVVCAVAGCRKEAPPESAVAQPRSEPSPATPSDPDAPPARPRIVAFGDSLTIGLGCSSRRPTRRCCSARSTTPAISSRCQRRRFGRHDGRGLRRLDWALEGDVRVLIVAFGGNDGPARLPVSQMKENLSSIIDKGRERNVIVILAGMEAPPNFGQEYATQFRQAFRDVACRSARSSCRSC
jgi:acyl-CoA thioesterase-1